jgi:hypothetical protein
MSESRQTSNTAGLPAHKGIAPMARRDELRCEERCFVRRKAGTDFRSWCWLRYEFDRHGVGRRRSQAPLPSQTAHSCPLRAGRADLLVLAWRSMDAGRCMACRQVQASRTAVAQTSREHADSGNDHARWKRLVRPASRWSEDRLAAETRALLVRSLAPAKPAQQRR